MARTVTNLATTPWRNFRPSPTTAAETAPVTTVATLPAHTQRIEGWRGMRLSFISTGADNETATVSIYGIDPFQSEDQGSAIGYRAQALGSWALTFGTSTLVVDTALVSDLALGGGVWRWADTCVWTASTYGTALLTYCGGNSAAFSPADNTIAEALYSDLGNMSHVLFLTTTYGLTATRKLCVLGKCDV